MPAVLIAIMERELHDPHRSELDARPQELAPQFSISDHMPLTALCVCSHDCRMVHDLDSIHFSQITCWLLAEIETHS